MASSRLSNPVFTAEPVTLDSDEIWMLKRMSDHAEAIAANIQNGYVKGVYFDVVERQTRHLLQMLKVYNGEYGVKTGTSDANASKQYVENRTTYRGTPSAYEQGSAEDTRASRIGVER